MRGCFDVARSIAKVAKVAIDVAGAGSAVAARDTKVRYIPPLAGGDRALPTSPAMAAPTIGLASNSGEVPTVTILLAPQTKANRVIERPRDLLAALQRLRGAVCRDGAAIFSAWQPLIQRRSFASSAANLADYLALRRHDLRQLQLALIPWGLSSLGRIEAKVQPNLDAVIATLGRVCEIEAALLPPHPPIEAFFEGDRLLQCNTDAVFGPPPSLRRGRIMVTLPTAAAYDDNLVRDLIGRGANCVRINCAHDSPAEWAAAIDLVRQAAAEFDVPCKVLMDLAGPKPRTGEVLTEGRLFPGDRLLLCRESPDPELPVAHQASCTLPEILDSLQIGEAVWMDDGRMGAIVEALRPEGALLQVTYTRAKGARLRPEKGLNFPDSNLRLSPLTAKDRADLDFVIAHADMVGYSFVQAAADIVLLQEEMQARDRNRARELAIVAKIETPKAVKNLPELIVHAAGKQPFGVMIARGDLAVELGYQRLAEMQEEILWLCEAAHIPVIWATQVLENLVKKGMPSRAEMTDAAMAERAECVMLNKGPFLAAAVTTLDEVLRRMQAHQIKKTPQLRALQSW